MMIEAVGLSRSFPATGRALSDVSLSVPRGSVTGLLGPNGAGKTTLFRILAGILRPDAGRAALCGHDTMAEPAAARALAGLVTQEPGLPDRLTPLWHVALHATLRGFARHDAVRCSRRLLERLGAGEVLDRPHATLSKGTRAKVALARVLVHDPVVLLLDEPTANLDMETSAAIRQTILDRTREGCAALLATHNPAEAEHLCDRFVFMGAGRVLAAGSLEALRAAAGFTPRLEARLSGPAQRVLEGARRFAGQWRVEARGDWLVFTMAERSRQTGSRRGPTAMEAAAAAAPLEVLEMRRVEAPLEAVYRRLHEGGA